ncbi:GMP synthase family protein [Desulfocurvibacter africanus PCS]|uniref:GMP synthase family protein n=1 Tax=Desulfocurvibacter africanus PCS TaxID=1262666 RepID=M5Q0U8_DESAF|nr:type 1 glutamine amidotransferase [Desulfocurvibacter africanus]EMG37016.1 GMP synthase family protein [Desulfocurvibacter africanus PCS]
MRMHFLEHAPYGGGAYIEQWAVEKGFDISRTKLHEGEALPSSRDYDALVVMGGPMSVNDDFKYPWLRAEKEHISKAVAQGRHVLGLCFGAQILAQALGAWVGRSPQPEVGWQTVRLTPYASGLRYLADFPPEFTALQWHYDAFDLPRHTVLLAESETCAQAFALGEQVLGLQFHLEATRTSLERLVADLGDALIPKATVQDAPTILNLADEHLPTLNRLCRSLCDRFFR